MRANCGAPKLPKLDCSWYMVSWEPEGHYCSSKMFHWEPEGCYRCTKSMVITPFWLSTDDLNIRTSRFTVAVTPSLKRLASWLTKWVVCWFRNSHVNPCGWHYWRVPLHFAKIVLPGSYRLAFHMKACMTTALQLLLDSSSQLSLELMRQSDGALKLWQRFETNVLVHYQFMHLLQEWT